MHQVGLPRRKKKKKKQLFMVAAGQSVSTPVHGVHFITMPMFLPSHQLSASTVNVCSHLSYMRVKYETQQLTYSEPRHA